MLVLVLLAPFFLAHYHGVTDYMNLATLKENKEFLHNFVAEHYFLSIGYYIITYALVGAFSFPFASLITLTGGFLFGTLLGTIYTNIGATIGASLAFLIYRYLFGTWVREHYSHRLIVFNREIEESGAWYLVVIRLIAIIPFFMANALASVAPISLKTFIWTTSIGIIPASLVYSFAGEQLDTINSMRDIFSGRVLFAFALLMFLIIVPVIVQHRRTRKA
jgi:uncharacterized membrane protein YdjX (TVP38/TMEM64 family)